MINTTSKLTRTATISGIVLLLLFMAFPAFAQQGSEVINASTTALLGIVQDVIRLLRVVLGIGALVTLVIVIFQVFKGEREAASKIAWWVAGLTLGFVLLSVVGNLIGS